MPVGAKIFAHLPGTLSDTDLAGLRKEFPQEVGMNVDEFYQKGPLIIIPDEDRRYIPGDDGRGTWINVNLLKAYYGSGYERGDLKLFVRIAEWLERNLPGSEVHYGHDVGDEHLSRFDKGARDELLAYYERVGHAPYHRRK